MATRQYLKQALTLALHPFGVYPTEMTESFRVEQLVESLHPVDPGWEIIRLGPNADGGYLIPNDLDGMEACFSPGVSMISGFELALANSGMEVFLADYSVDGPTENHDRFHFIRKFIGVTERDLFLPLDQWVEDALPGSTGDLILQMDIEGYEYENFLSVSDRLLRRLRIMVVEFHSLDLLFSKPFFNLASRAFSKILQTHACIHIHPNNTATPVKKAGLLIPPVMEFSFLRRDRLKGNGFRNDFPHVLDFDCTYKPSVPLPECWYKRT